MCPFGSQSLAVQVLYNGFSLAQSSWECAPIIVCYRIWPCDASVEGWQDVLHDVCNGRHTAHSGPAQRPCRETHDSSHSVPAVPKQSAGPPLSGVVITPQTVFKVWTKDKPLINSSYELWSSKVMTSQRNKSTLFKQQCKANYNKISNLTRLI